MEGYSIRKTRQGRFKICLSDGSFFFIPASFEPLFRIALETGDAAEFENLKAESQKKTAYIKAVDLLSRREHTTAELSQKLRQRGFRENEIDFAIEECTGKNYLNDERAAKVWLENCRNQGRYSFIQAVNKLREKGIEREMAQELAKEIFTDDNQINAVLHILRRSRSADRQKLEPRLRRRGFPYAVITKAFELYGESGKES